MADMHIVTDTFLSKIMREIVDQYEGQWDFGGWVQHGGSMNSSEVTHGLIDRTANVKKPILMLDNPFGGGGNTKSGGNHWYRTLAPVQDDIGKSGDLTVEGTGTVQQLEYSHGYINQKRYTFLAKDGNMAKQNLGAWQDNIMAKVPTNLHDKASRFAQTRGMAYSMLYGFSHHILASVADGGFNVTRRFHPNFFIPGLPAGKDTTGRALTTWSATSATYEGRLATNLALVQADVAFRMNAVTLKKIHAYARRYIKPMTMINGKPHWLLEVTQEQWADLLTDATILKALEIWSNNKNDQSDVLVNNCDLIYNNLIIVSTVRGTARQVYFYGVADPTLTDTPEAAPDRVRFGPVTLEADIEKNWSSVSGDDVISAVPSGGDQQAHLNLHSATLWGAAGIVGVNVPMNFAGTKQKLRAGSLTSEEWDHGAKIEFALAQIYGYSRQDWYNAEDITSATTVRNETSAQIITYSPNSNVAG